MSGIDSRLILTASPGILSHSPLLTLRPSVSSALPGTAGVSRTHSAARLYRPGWLEGVGVQTSLSRWVFSMKMNRGSQIHDRGMWFNQEKCVKKRQRRKAGCCIVRDLIPASNTQFRAQDSAVVSQVTCICCALQLPVVQNLSVQNLPAYCGVISRPALVLRVTTRYVWVGGFP